MARIGLTRIAPLKLIASLLVVLAATPALADGAALDPAKTFVFSASIVKWPASAGLATFTDERKDAALMGAFNAAGVSSDNITFLTDEKATLAAIRKELRAIATRAGEGSTLVFSFQGHGGKQKGKTYLMCYDVGDDVPKTAFAVSEIATILDECWKGERLILIGDCCHSGALAEVVAHYEKTNVKAASFTSATASNRSTEHWTFTDAFIDALRGDGRLDRDHDGTITFAETDRWIHEVMKFREGQLTRAARTTSFEEGFGVHKAANAVADLPGAIEIGDYVDALDREKKWYLAEVEGFEDGKYKVHYIGWERKWDEVVEPARIRPPEAKKLDVGGRYEVEWDDKQWYPGTVTKVEEGWFFFVHYEGESGEDDEWITAGRARKPSAPEFKPAAEHAAAKKGDVVAARWRTQWFLAKVTEVDATTIVVLYDDGTTGRVLPEELIHAATADELHVGDRVLACWKDAHMYAGKVEKKGPKVCKVKWEDGSTVSDVEVGKLARIAAGPPAAPPKRK